jgi:hypothetical protein
MKNIFTNGEREIIVKKLNTPCYKSPNAINQERVDKVKTLITQDKFSIEEFVLIGQILEFIAFVPFYDKIVEDLEKKVSMRLNKLTGKNYEELSIK